jgi:hypothetical protein
LSAVVLARRTFRWAGIYGLIVLFPTLFLEARIGIDAPPPITHPEYYYGFVGLALAWQLVFLVIGSDPVRFRPLMWPAVAEKFSWGAAAFGLALAGRAVAGGTMFFAAIDVALGCAFIVARQHTPVK